MCKIGVSSSPACACGTIPENSYHYFFDCHRYTNERNTLQLSILCIPRAIFTIDIILNGSSKCSKAENKVIFEAVHTHISTGRFT